jgi:hypothetical protein
MNTMDVSPCLSPLPLRSTSPTSTKSAEEPGIDGCNCRNAQPDRASPGAVRHDGVSYLPRVRVADTSARSYLDLLTEATS